MYRTVGESIMFDNNFLNQLRVKPIFRTDIYYGFLFHGTRRYSFECSKEEREAINNAAKIINDFTDDLIRNGSLNDARLKEYSRTKTINNLPTSFGFPMAIPGKTIPSKTYSHGDFYVTSDFESAVEYSENPGGEYLFWAYCNLIGLKDFGIDVPDEVKKAMELLENEYPKHESSERVVVAISGIELKDLLSERGERLQIDEENFESLYLDNQAYRIINFEKYRDHVVIIPEKYFDQAIKALEAIKR